MRQSSRIENDAWRWCKYFHRGQKRKYTNEPYETHPRGVWMILNDVLGEDYNELVGVAALLHDTVEDTPCTLSAIAAHFGDKVACWVAWCTDIATPQHGNRKQRTTLNRMHLSLAPTEAKNIKVADLIHNTSSIVQHDPNFAKVYMDEKEEVLHHLGEFVVLYAMH